MSRKERLITLAESFKRFQFAGAVHGAVGIITDIQRNDSDRVARNQKLVFFLVIQGKGKDSAQVFQKADAFFTVEGQHHLAVGTRLEGIFPFVAVADVAMVVYFAVHGQNLFPVGREQGLPAALRVHNREAFVRQNGAFATVDATPVRTAVPDLGRHPQRLVAQGFGLLLDIEYCYDSTHSCSCLCCWL